MSDQEDPIYDDGYESSQSQPVNEQELPEKPLNHGETFKFHVLYEELFNPLTENLRKPTNAQIARGRKAGPHGPSNKSPHEKRREIIDRFFSRWRLEVGDNIYPALRLILPEKDRERAMYGLKEKILARYLVKIMKIDKNSEDAYSLINWKRPGQTSGTAGDFAGRVFEIISKRALRIEPGDMTITEVNKQLGQLSAETKEEKQLPLLENFYQRMNAEEMMWLIRIILRNMRVGATEKTFLDVWHPDAETLFNVCSSLRRVCEELYKPEIRLEKDERGVSLMACYQPQLAYFNEKKQSSFTSMVTSMKQTDDDQEFWIEEKLDGERMQLHMTLDDTIEGGKKFQFWSRKAKDYTYLYGCGLKDKSGSLTRNLEHAFADGVENIILDGEMITWDPELDVMVPFGSLKTAALSENKNPYLGGMRPFYRVFDILYLNDNDITRYTLRDRRRALEASIRAVPRRLEILEHAVGTTPEDIESRLQKAVQEASEGLVLKNPRSAYKLNDRHDDWVKVKPEYMNEFGESLDCVIIGGYYGSGHRGGSLSSFLCGLRDDRKPAQDQSDPDQNRQSDTPRFLSFFKVGGGMTRDEYKAIQHQTEGKWRNWDPKRPPTDLFELAGGPKQLEKPDQWIHPSDSLVVEVKAASVNATEDYATGVTLRFPRFKKFRPDKDWKTALTLQEFRNLKESVEEEHAQNQKKAGFEAARRRPDKNVSRTKKPLTVAGYNARATNNVQVEKETSDVFNGLTIFVMTESTRPVKKSKLELEELVKANGGKIVQSSDIKAETNNNHQIDGKSHVLCVAERRTVKVASLIKRGNVEVVKPSWLFDCIEQGRRDTNKGLRELVLPFEPERHLFFVPQERKNMYDNNVDEYSDSFARDTSVEELKEIMTKMGQVSTSYDEDIHTLLNNNEDTRGTMFITSKMYFDPVKNSDAKPQEELEIDSAKRTALFGGATIATDISEHDVSHVIVHASSDIRSIRKTISSRKKIARIVKLDWIRECWAERTRVDEEKYPALHFSVR